MLRSLPLSLALLVGVAVPAYAQPMGNVGEYSDVVVEGSILEPKPITVSDDAELAKLIHVPDGFKVEVVARDLGNTRMLAVHHDHVYATRRTEGDVILLVDADGDGKYESHKTVAARPGMHGIAIDGDTVYLVTVHDVYTAPIKDDGTFGDLTRIIDDLPDAGQHANRTIAIGPDDMLWITVGSTCNECAEPNPENATILRVKKDGTSRTIFARGLRNTIGFDFEPTTGQLYGADHGIDWLGDEEQQEELNLIEEGKQYGWPYIYGFSSPNPHINPPEGLTLEDWARLSTEPKLGYTPHSAPMQMLFYTGTAFPEEYRGDAFIAQRGSWNRRPPSGYEISRVDFADGKPKTWEHFAEGFLIQQEDGGYGFLARLAGITQTMDGALLLADDFNGIIYRISYGDAAATDMAEAQPAMAPDAMPKPVMSDIAVNLVEAEGTIEVTTDFAADAMIPISYAAEGHNASPPLAWLDVPEGTQSLVVIVDDPDAAAPKPFVHWVAYDIPASEPGLREGLPGDPILQEPKGMLQGRNSRGEIGYTGPRPPLGDPAHHYHFQIFALDVATLGLDPGATKEEVLAAFGDHVLAEGEIVGTYQRPAPEKPQN